MTQDERMAERRTLCISHALKIPTTQPEIANRLSIVCMVGKL